ncbi:MAG: HAMP domain-containing sensor histidine kinase [bacterium]
MSFFVLYLFVQRNIFYAAIVNPFLCLLYVCFVALFFHDIRLFLQDKTSKFFFISYQNYDLLLPKLTKVLGFCIDLDQLLLCFKDTWFPELNVSRFILLIPKEQEDVWQHDWVCYLISNMETQVFEVSSKEMTIFSHVSSDTQLYFYDQISPKLKVFFDRHHLSLLLPCFGPARLNGFFCIGKKKNDKTFYNNDISLYKVLAGHIALALQHIQPYESIKRSYEKYRENLEKASQQSAFSSLSMGISHEIRNPMAGILTRTELLEKDPDNVEDVKEFVQRVKRDIFRVLNITDIMLRYGSPVVKDMTLISMPELLDDILFMAKGKCQQTGIRIQKNFIANLKPVIGDSNRLYQVFTNIVLNAIEAMSDSSEKLLSISTLYHTFTSQGKLTPGVVVIIQDTGCGMSAEVLQRIFDPFYTTKYKNTGLGLSIVAKVVNDHNGLLKIFSTPKKGTEFRISLVQG